MLRSLGGVGSYLDARSDQRRASSELLTGLVTQLETHINNGSEALPAEFLGQLKNAFENENVAAEKKQQAFAQLNQALIKTAPQVEDIFSHQEHSGYGENYIDIYKTNPTAVAFNKKIAPENFRIDDILQRPELITTLIACALATPKGNLQQKDCSVLASLRNSDPTNNKQLISAFARAGSSARGTMLETALNTHANQSWSNPFVFLRNTHSKNIAEKVAEYADRYNDDALGNGGKDLREFVCAAFIRQEPSLAPLSTALSSATTAPTMLTKDNPSTIKAEVETWQAQQTEKLSPKAELHLQGLLAALDRRIAPAPQFKA